MEHSLIKKAYIKKMPNGKYRVLSESGKNLGTYDSKEEAKKRLNQVEYFKHRDKQYSKDKENKIDLTDLEELSYSSIVRCLRKKSSNEQVKEFISIFKINFDSAVIKQLESPDKIALQKTLVQFNEHYPIKLNKDIVKFAAVSELGNAILVGKYLSDIVKFTISRIPDGKRPRILAKLKNKLYNLNEAEIASKNLPDTSAMGQSITFIKHVLFNHNPNYIREVLNNVVKNL